MEISAGLKKDITSVQGEITKAIQDHQALASKLREFPEFETRTKQDLSGIQKHIIELNEKQKVLLQQLRKEIQDNLNGGQFLPVFNFNLYKIKPGQLESKKRRRKDLSLAPKVVTCRPAHSPPSLSPSPTPSSSSSLSDDSVEYISPFMLPVPVPKARPMLLPDVKENVYLGGVSRRDLRPPKLKRNQKILSDEEVFKDIPVYYDPVPSPPPTDEKDLKARFMTALSLIPKEMLHDILNRKVERKRRSTATNNPNFVYNNDWEIPAWKRSRTYLSPHKLGKPEAPLGKKVKVEDLTSENGSSSKHGKKEKDSDCDKSGKICLENVKLTSGTTVEKAEVKSRNSTPDSTSSNALCFVCHTSGLLDVCKDCSVSYHSSCVQSNSSFISCPCCKHKRFVEDGSSEESSKEEFAAKCPNVAESYSKLKEYIENHTDSDAAALYTERENFKVELMAKNQELYCQKRELEEKAAKLSEALLLQEDAKNNLLKEKEKILKKIKVIVDFVTLYQKTMEKNANEKSETASENEEKEISNGGSEEKKSGDGENETEDVGKMESTRDEEKNDLFRRNCDSPSSSSKESFDDSQANACSSEQLSQGSLAAENTVEDGFSRMSKESPETCEKPTTEQEKQEDEAEEKEEAETVGNGLAFKTEEGENRFNSHPSECSVDSEGIGYESSIE